ncbi:MAG: sensor histidine kinase [Mucilaginibacter sp.]
MTNEFVITIFVVTMLLAGLTSFILVSYILYRKKHLLSAAEKENLISKFQKELLISEMEVKEQTLQTIGADLHDNVGQFLSLISLTLKSIKLENPDINAKKIADAVELTGRSIKELRQLGKLIQGDQLISQGLNEAIRQEVRWLEKSGRFTVEFKTIEIPIENSNRDKDLILFRMFQEIINNIIKHSEAEQITISLESDGRILKLTISDNGKGLNESSYSNSNGLGLKTIQKRALLIGAEIDSWPVQQGGLGYTIRILYP